DDRNPQSLGRLGDALDRLRQLPADLGLFGVPEVEAIGQRQRLAAGTGDVQGCAEHGLRARGEWVELADRRPVERDGESPVGGKQPLEGRVQSRPPYWDR